MKTESLNLLQRLSKVSALWRSTYNNFLLHTWGKWGPVVSARMTAMVTTLCRLQAWRLGVLHPWVGCMDAPLQVNHHGADTGQEGLHLHQWLGVGSAVGRASEAHLDRFSAPVTFGSF